jgi:hypothetical protein
MRHVAQRIANRARLSQIRGHRMQRRKRARAEADEADAVVTLDPTQHYDMADTTRENENILEWVFSNRSDVATKVLCSSEWQTY